VTPKDYTGIRLSRRPPKVTDEDVSKALEGYRRQHTAYLPVEGREITADDDLLRVEVHGKVGEDKIKTKTVTVDLTDENAGGLPGLASRLRGVPVNASGWNCATAWATTVPSRAWRAKKSACAQPSRKCARARCRHWTTSWPRTPARPARSTS